MNAITHFGVYGLWKQAGQIVLIRKSRGPYSGLLDLPGGSPEISETEDQTLARELEEECGVLLDSIHRQAEFTIHVDRSSTGDALDLTHSGLMKSVTAIGRVEHRRAFEDVASVELFDRSRHSTEELSPLVREALRLFPEFRSAQIGSGGRFHVPSTLDGPPDLDDQYLGWVSPTGPISSCPCDASPARQAKA